MIQSHELFVLKAYDRNANGDLYTAFDPMQMRSEADAVAEARSIAREHDGAVVWKQSADPAVGEFGPAEIVFQQGRFPRMVDRPS